MRARQLEIICGNPKNMKFLICIISLALLFFQSGFACTVDIWKIKAAAVRGKVTDAYKNPVPNASIQIYRNKGEGVELPAETRADENGRFEIKNFPSGKYMIKAEAGHFAGALADMKLKSKKAAARER